MSAIFELKDGGHFGYQLLSTSLKAMPDRKEISRSLPHFQGQGTQSKSFHQNLISAILEF